MGGLAAEGWEDGLERWLEPFLGRLRRRARRGGAPGCRWRGGCWRGRRGMGGLAAEGWEDGLERWLEPFLGRLRRRAQRRWAPVYLKGLFLPGERKSVEPMAARVAPRAAQQPPHA